MMAVGSLGTMMSSILTQLDVSHNDTTLVIMKRVTKLIKITPGLIAEKRGTLVIYFWNNEMAMHSVEEQTPETHLIIFKKIIQ